MANEPMVVRFRVIDSSTNEEADIEKIALREDWAKNLVYCDMEGFVVAQDGTLALLDECGNYAWCPPGRFRLEWQLDPVPGLPSCSEPTLCEVCCKKVGLILTTVDELGQPIVRYVCSDCLGQGK